ncbi:MAG: hypothetical protein V3T05_04865 [Myxococcota bacterium]
MMIATSKLGLFAVGLTIGALVPTTAQGEKPPPAAPAAESSNTEAPNDDSSKTDARFDISQLYTDDNVTPNHLSYSQLRSRIVATNPFGMSAAELHLDGRYRYGWTSATDDVGELHRLSFQYGNRKSAWMATIGRQVITSLAGARVDGAYLGVGLGESAQAGLFGGLMPHPLSGDLDSRFSTAGAAYDYRSKTSNHGGGLALQMFRGAPDRLYLNERLYLRLGDAWMVYARALVDFLAPRGILGELGLTQKGEELGLDGLDLTNAQLRVRYEHAALLDVSLTGTHTHTVLPNRWWTNKIREERARRGFVVDGNDPVGSRRSTAMLMTNIHVGRELTPYLVLRYDHRHNDSENGYEGRPGLKMLLGGTGYLDVHYSYHQYFTTRNNRLSVSYGQDLIDLMSVDAGVTAMHTKPRSGEALWLFDLYASLAARLGLVDESLRGIDAMVQYQGFVDEEMIYHLLFFRLAYRFRG